MEANKPTTDGSEELNDPFDDRFRNYRSAAHYHSGERGHWWEKHDEEPPEDWEEPGSTIGSIDNGNLPPEHQADVPEDWEPSNYRVYYCHICADGCINPVSSPYSQRRECRSCYIVPALEEAPPSGSRSGSSYLG